ncbi:MAG: DUF2179 domain-containing protein [Firmicutes bacterium]|nr:DUF2179 domain-containing protein [Bacillota bacterium]
MDSTLLFIFFARIFDVSFSTVRVLMLTKGKRLLAAMLGFFEVSIYITALSQVVQELNSPIKVLIYALGFSSGTLVGGFIEEKIALGYAMVQLIPKKHASQLIMALRAENFGVTVVEGKGRTGTRLILNIMLRRKDLPRFINVINQVDPESFFTIFDARSTKGGYILGDKK